MFVTLVGHGFKQSIYFFQRCYKTLHIPPVLRPVIPFLLSLPVGLCLSYSSGGGEGLIKALTEQSFPLMTLLMFLTVKLLFTGISAGSGAIGGIFVPLLACGAAGGALYATALVHLGLLAQEYVNAMILFGMAACFTTVIKAPLTACVIVFETSGALHQLSGLVLTCFSAYLTANLIGSQAHDHILLTQILESEYQSPDQKTSAGVGVPQLYELPIGLHSVTALKKVREIDWPQKCRIVGVIHGEHEIIPDGTTILYPGDKLIVLAEDNTGILLKQLTDLTDEQAK